MSGVLGGQVFLVTGSAGGIGSAIADSIRGAGGIVAPFDLAQGNVGDDDDVRRVLGRVLETHGRLDGVIHAAGITRDQVLWKLTPDDWDRVQQANLRSAFLLLHHCVPVMRRSDGGRVVFLGSINGSRGKFGQTAYAASKAGLIGLARSAARETGRFGIRVNVVEPGMVRTPMTENLPPEIIRAAEEESLLGKLAEPSDIAAAVLFLCGPGGGHITGQVLRVDGGQYL